MELASMLAGEPFGDHPASVCPVIGSFLGAYNDSIDDDRRQDLYAYASRVVGSRSCEEVQRLRAERLAAWASVHQRRWRRRLFALRRSPVLQLKHPLEAAGVNAVRAISKHTHESHADALALIDELLAIGGRERPPDAHRARVVVGGLRYRSPV